MPPRSRKKPEGLGISLAALRITGGSPVLRSPCSSSLPTLTHRVCTLDNGVELWLGSLMAFPGDDQFRQFTHVVDVSGGESDRFYEGNLERHAEYREVLRKRGCLLEFRGVSEFTLPKAVPDIRRMIDFVNRAESGSKIFFHCLAGQYRSPTFLAAYLISTKEFTVESAIQTICGNEQGQSCRPDENVLRVELTESPHPEGQKSP